MSVSPAATSSNVTRIGPHQRGSGPPQRRQLRAAAARAAWSFDHPVLTTEGRRLLEDRADELRTLVLPTLRTTVNDPDCDGHTYAVYAHAYYELQQLEATLAAAHRISTRKCDPSVVELGDLVTIEVLDTEPSRTPTGSHAGGCVQRFLLVHPVEGALDDLRISAASPLARAVLGRAIGNVVQVGAPAGSYPVRILATKRSGVEVAQGVSWASAAGVRPAAAPSWPRTGGRHRRLSASAFVSGKRIR